MNFWSLDLKMTLIYSLDKLGKEELEKEKKKRRYSKAVIDFFIQETIAELRKV